MVENNKMRDKILKIVCMVSVVALLISLYISFELQKIDSKIGVLYGDYLFSDFAETISYCISKNPYNGIDGIRSIYPPFAFLIFYPFALICKEPLQAMLDGEIPLKVMYKETSFVVSYILYYVINMAIILFVVAKMSKLKGKNLVYLLVSIFCFGPFIFAFGRANVITTAFLFGLIFFWLYNSDKKWEREVANLSLACCIAIKIYPILLVIFFLKDKRYKDLLKTIAYSLLLLFVPFLLIDGGFSNIGEIWKNFTVFSTGEGRNDDSTNISLDSLCYKFFAPISLSLYSLMSSLTRYGLLLLSIVVLCLSKKSEKTMQCMLISICTYELWQGVSYGYTMLFIAIPLILYFDNFNKFSKIDKWWYGICFALIAFPCFYVIKLFTIQAITLVALVVKAIIDLFIDRFKKTEKQLIA